MKRIDVTCGYRVEYSNGDIYYYGGETDNGVCYKDMDAWESGEGVCYLCEGDFLEQDNDNNEWVFALGSDSSFPNTRDDIMNLMSEYLAGCDVKLIEQCAEYALETCDWQCLDTLMGEVNWEEDIRDVYKEGTEVLFNNKTYKVEQFWDENAIEIFGINDGIYNEWNVGIKDIYRKSDKVCKHCGGPLYHEKYDNTQDHYPYFCPECDENFFEFEAR